GPFVDRSGLKTLLDHSFRWKANGHPGLANSLLNIRRRSHLPRCGPWQRPHALLLQRAGSRLRGGGAEAWHRLFFEALDSLACAVPFSPGGVFHELKTIWEVVREIRTRGVNRGVASIHRLRRVEQNSGLTVKSGKPRLIHLTLSLPQQAVLRAHSASGTVEDR